MAGTKIISVVLTEDRTGCITGVHLSGDIPSGTKVQVTLVKRLPDGSVEKKVLPNG